MAITSRQALSDYCLRALGGGVVNIEISDEMIDDRIEDAIEWYHERHFDGIERDYLSLPVTASVITVASSVGFAVGDIVTVSTTTGASITAINGNDLTITRMVGGHLTVGQTLSNGSVSSAITAVNMGSIDNKYFPTDETIVGVKKILNVSNVISSTETLFNVNYQIMMSEIKNLTSAGTSYLYSAMTYLGNLDYIMKTEKDFRFNRRMGKLYLDINWDTIAIGDYMVAEVYRYVDDAVYKRVLNDIWLKKYATALLKRQWGQNLSKFDGMTLPGNIQYNGKYILEQAMTEIQALEDEAINSSAPLEFLMG